MAIGVGFELLVAPIRERGAQLRLRGRHAALAVDRGVAAAEHDFRLPVELAQQLRLPGVEDVGADRRDVAKGQNVQKLQALEALHHAGEGLNRARIADVAVLRDDRHVQMMLDEPGDGLRFARREAQPRA